MAGVQGQLRAMEALGIRCDVMLSEHYFEAF